MSYQRKFWSIDEVVKPEDANRWEGALASQDGSGTGTVSGGNLVIVTNNDPDDPNDFYVDFIAPEDYDKTKSIVINGVTYPAGFIKDIQQTALPNKAWKAGAPVRLRIVNGSVFLMGGGGGSRIHIGATPPTEAEDLVWIDTTVGQFKYRTVAGATTWSIVKGVYNT